MCAAGSTPVLVIRRLRILEVFVQKSVSWFVAAQPPNPDDYSSARAYIYPQPQQHIHQVSECQASNLEGKKK